VAARIQVARGDDVRTITPKLVMKSGAMGGGMESQPADINLAGYKYEASIRQIMAEQEIVVLDVPGLIPVMAPAKLILDVSRKPMIGLVWVGTTLIILGSFIVLYRRRSELIALDAA